jgi:hypothetical protein
MTCRFLATFWSTRQVIDLEWIHCLNRIIDDQKRNGLSESIILGRNRLSERIQLALRHHPTAAEPAPSTLTPS